MRAMSPLRHGGALLRRLLAPLAVLLGLVVTGTAGYRLVEGWSVLDALYMTVITITTVGFLEVHPMGTAGRFFTMGLALGGVFTAFYAAAEFIRAVVTGEIRTVLGRQRMESRLEKLRGHLVVCGFGRMGRLVAEEFSAAGLDFVVVDREAKVLEGFALPGGIPLVGEATADDVLRQAGVERARALVTAAASDADNLFITLSARLLNERLLIVARAESEGAEVKLRRAGASRVVSPYNIGGHRVAQAVLRPNAMDFIELATRTGHLELQIEETPVRPESPLAGQTLKTSPVRSEMGVIVVAIKKPDGKMAFNPSPEAVLEAGDILIALGRREQLDRLEGMAAGTRGAQERRGETGAIAAPNTSTRLDT
jgi:voltage-gated potassium channel